MTATEKLDALINDAYRNRRDEACSYLKQLRDPVARLESERDAALANLKTAREALAAITQRAMCASYKMGYEIMDMTNAALESTK